MPTDREREYYRLGFSDGVKAKLKLKKMGIAFRKTPAGRKR